MLLQWADVLALSGDAADNVPGVKGVGIKTAPVLVRTHGNIEGVLAAAQDERKKVVVRLTACALQGFLRHQAHSGKLVMRHSGFVITHPMSFKAGWLSKPAMLPRFTWDCFMHTQIVHHVSHASSSLSGSAKYSAGQIVFCNKLIKLLNAVCMFAVAVWSTGDILQLQFCQCTH